MGPAVLATTLYGGDWFRVVATVEAVAVGGFALAYLVLFVRTDRDRVGLYGVLAGALAGLAGVALGLWFAFGSATGPLVAAHLRLNVAGFLGLTIVGVSYQFYPPAVGTLPGVGNRTALASIVAIAGGLVVEVAGLLADAALATALGRAGVLVGAALYAWVVLALFYERHWQGALTSSA